MNKTLRAFETAVERTLDRYGMWTEGQAALAAISAGPDSTALLAALAAAKPRRKGRLYAFHVDHGVRGEESRADRRAARALARELKVPFRSVRLEPARRGSDSEESMRNRRFEAIRAEARRRRATAVFLGHHADDLAETLLLRLVRGAGLEGMAAFGPVEEREGLRLFRPLIEFTREEILRYLAARGLPYRIDRSNEDQRFLRNRLRHRVIPLLAETANPRIRPALARAARLLQTDADLLGRLSREALEKRARFVGSQGGVLELAGWPEIHPALRTRILRELCRRAARRTSPPYSRHVAQLDRLALTGRNGAYVTVWSGLAAYRDRAALRIVLPQCRGRPTRSQAYEALREQALADSGWEAFAPPCLLALGHELSRRPDPFQLDLRAGTGSFGSIRWRLELISEETPKVPVEDSDSSQWRLEFRWPAPCALTVALAPLDRLTAFRQGQRVRRIGSWLAARSRTIPLFWREALPTLFSNEEVLYVAGLGPLAPLVDPPARQLQGHRLWVKFDKGPRPRAPMRGGSETEGCASP